MKIWSKYLIDRVLSLLNDELENPSQVVQKNDVSAEIELNIIVSNLILYSIWLEKNVVVKRCPIT